MNVIIFGSEGFVGKNLSNDLKNDFNLIFSDIFDSDKVNYVKADITDFSELKKLLKGIDIVVNLASPPLTSSLNYVREFSNITINGIINILEASRLNNVKKIIFPSASSMIGSIKKSPVPEDHEATPTNPYGIAKLASEHFIRIYKELYGINFVIFRFFNIYGPYQKNGVIPNLFSKIKNNKPVTIFGEGNQIRDYVFIKDISNFFKISISSNKADNNIINMGTGIGHSVMDLINIMSKKLNITPEIDFKPKRVGEIDNFVADTSLIKNLFGKSPSTNLEIGLTKTIDWLNSNKLVWI